MEHGISTNYRNNKGGISRKTDEELAAEFYEVYKKAAFDAAMANEESISGLIRDYAEAEMREQHRRL